MLLTGAALLFAIGMFAVVLNVRALSIVPFAIAGSAVIAVVLNHLDEREAAKPPVQITADRIMVDPASGCRYLREGLTGLVQMLRADGLPDCRQP
jgi:hypothetical protein